MPEPVDGMAPAGRIHPSVHDDPVMEDTVDIPTELEAPPLLGRQDDGPRSVTIFGLWRFATSWELVLIL